MRASPGVWAQPLPAQSLRPLHARPLSLCPGVEGLSLDMSSLVDIRDYVNKELALRIHTDIDSQGAFFTDLNGFQVIFGAPESAGSRHWERSALREEEESETRAIRDSFRLGTRWSHMVPGCL